MRRYAVVGDQAVPSTVTGDGSDTHSMILELAGTSAVVPHLYMIHAGSVGTPADQQYSFRVARGTALAATADSVTPEPIDIQSNVASASSAQSNATEAPSTLLTANSFLFDGIFNARSTYNWIEDPDRGVMGPASTATIMAYFLDSTGGTPTVRMTWHFAE